MRENPTVVMTAAEAEVNMAKSCQLQPNCHLSKSAELNAFESVVQSIDNVRRTMAKLPQQKTPSK
jgi:two-component system, chemotaxis family, response regulator Rcp1